MSSNATGGAYAASGVNIDAGNRAVELMSQAVRGTYNERVLAGIGAFGGLFDAADVKHLNAPVLVASTDSVGTKVDVAARAGRFDGIGQDLVNHCVNDILVQGARPLFFLDYVASSETIPERISQIVSGMAMACRAAGCVLLGGETAELPGVYAPSHFDIVGSIVGLVDRANMLPRPTVQAGDVLVGLNSSGAHTNGYSLIRKVFAGVPLEMVYPELGVPLAEALLAPHRSYLNLLAPFLVQPSPLKALAHITGGGLLENVPRMLPAGLCAVIETERWQIPSLFKLIQQRGEISQHEMARVFNLGIGMVALVAQADVKTFQARLVEDSFVIGNVVAGEHSVRLV